MLLRRVAASRALPHAPRALVARHLAAPAQASRTAPLWPPDADAVDDADAIAAAVQRIAAQQNAADDLDLERKAQLLAACEQELRTPVPNAALGDIGSVADAIAFFQGAADERRAAAAAEAAHWTNNLPANVSLALSKGLARSADEKLQAKIEAQNSRADEFAEAQKPSAADEIMLRRRARSEAKHHRRDRRR